VKLWDAATGRLVRSLKGDGFVFYPYAQLKGLDLA